MHFSLTLCLEILRIFPSGFSFTGKKYETSQNFFSFSTEFEDVRICIHTLLECAVFNRTMNINCNNVTGNGNGKSVDLSLVKEYLMAELNHMDRAKLITELTLMHPAIPREDKA